MSTYATADLGSSSDEEDADFVPEEAGPSKKRLRPSSPTEGNDDPAATAKAEAEAKARKERAAAAFAAMQESTKLDKTQSTSGASSAKKEELVEVKRLRRFAGATIEETVQLPRDYPEAIAYLSRTQAPTEPDSGKHVPPPVESKPQEADETAQTDNVAKADVRPTSKPKGPLKRKPRQSLEQMSAALDRGKKMTTLEKSQMDWKSHTSSDTGMQDELDANRRGGGYLEKQNFLERVEQRKEAQNAARSGKR